MSLEAALAVSGARGGDGDARRGDWEGAEEAVNRNEDIGSAAAGGALRGRGLALRLTQW